MTIMNVFRILADVSHSVSKCTLIWAIHVNRSAEGVSLITQILYAVVFCSRYLDVFYKHSFNEQVVYNTIMKIFYISSSLWIIFIMLRLFPRTREREVAWKFGALCLGGSLVLAPFTMLIFNAREAWSFLQFLWVLSIILESVCVLPQLMLLRQTSVPTVIDSMYLLTLGSYRALYILNWIERGITEEGEPRPIAVIFGVIQTLFYIDFAWVYYTRQRVKLRNGAIVDADDLSRGYIVSKILGPAPASADIEDGQTERAQNIGARGGSATGGLGGWAQRATQSWGRRGISVSADDELDDPSVRPVPPAKNNEPVAHSGEREGMLSNPDAFEDEDSDVDDALPAPLPRS